MSKLSDSVMVLIVVAVFLALGASLDAVSVWQATASQASAGTAFSGGGAPGARRRPQAASENGKVTVALAPPAPAVMQERNWSPDTAFAFHGHWEHVRRLYDGRSNGSSSRSFRPGARATLTFRGTFVRLFGIIGPGGGAGSVTLDGRPPRVVTFYAPRKAVHQLIFDSSPLPAGVHRLTIGVAASGGAARRRGYVNVDGAEYGS